MGSPFEQGVLQLAWERYLYQLHRRPLRTKALTSASLAGLSDLVAQSLTSKAPLNYRRTVAVALFGLVWGGPSGHYWQMLMERVFKGRKDAKTVAKRVILDQLTYGPFMNALVMIYIASVVEGRSWSFTRDKLKKDFPSVQLNGWRLWPLVSIFNYRYVPVELRVLVINIVAFFWSTFLITRSRTALTSTRR